MFVELGITFGLYKLWQWLNGAELRRFKEYFTGIMKEVGCVNKSGETFQVIDIKPAGEGAMFLLSIPKGLSVDHLKSKQNVLEDNFSAVVQIEKDKFKSYIKLTMVDVDIDKFEFKPVKTPTNKLYIGKDAMGKNYFLDLNKHPQVLIAGATGYGKSMILASILTNMIYNSADEVEIYLTQLIKGEITSFENCKGVEYTACSESDIENVVNIVRKKIDERTELLKKTGIRNIVQYNKHFKKDKMKRIFLICEEFSELMELDIGSELYGIAKAGRSVGIHLIGVLQRTTATNLDTNVKSQMTRITFHQNSIIDSQNVINSNNAMGLKQGECIVVANNGEDLVKVPFIDDDFLVLHKYVPEIAIPTKEEKIEVKNIKKNKEKIVIEEVPEVVDVEYKKVKTLPPKQKKRTEGKGVLSEDDNGDDIFGY